MMIVVINAIIIIDMMMFISILTLVDRLDARGIHDQYLTR